MIRCLLVMGALSATLGLTTPGYCFDQGTRTQAAEALVARDAAQLELRKARTDAKAVATDVIKAWNAVEEKAALLTTELKKKQETQGAADVLAQRPTVSPAPSNTITAADLTALETQLVNLKAKVDAAILKMGTDEALLSQARPLATDADKLAKSAAKAAADVTAADKKAAETEQNYKAKQRTFTEATGPVRFFTERLRSARQLRCMTAYCYGGSDGTKYAIEPVLDLPVGLVWSAGSGALSSYINAHTVNVEFTAGLRFWLGYDIMSISVYFSRPLIDSTDPIRVEGSSYEHTTKNIHRPFPSLGIGLAGDVLLLGISYDQLRNGGSDSMRDRTYPSNAVLSRSLTFSLGFSLFNLSKNALGASRESAKGEDR